MSIGLFMPEDPNGEKSNFEITEEDVKNIFDKTAQKVASFFNSMNLTEEKIDYIKSLQDYNKFISEENRTLKTAIEHFFKDSEIIRNEAIKEFGNLLISKSKNGIINVSDILDFVAEMVGDNK